mgnify:CR=1 FL=1
MKRQEARDFKASFACLLAVFYLGLVGSKAVLAVLVARSRKVLRARGYLVVSRALAVVLLLDLSESTNEKIGPLSEASLGNVGLEDPCGHSLIDYVNTPVLGVFGVSVLEDMADHYINKRVERNHR